MGRTTTTARSREQRRARIEHTALELFRTRGFDHVTVEDVCAAAVVAPATFYRHFGTKEAVVFAYRDDFEAVLRATIESVTDLPEADRLPAVIAEFAGFLESQSELLAQRDEIVVGHPRLMQRTLMVQRELEGVLAAGLAQLRGSTRPDSTALLEAGIGMLVLRVAVRSWRAGEHDSLLRATQLALADLRDLVGRPPERRGSAAGRP
jgi:AcrR family transcriptional regulator